MEHTYSVLNPDGHDNIRVGHDEASMSLPMSNVEQHRELPKSTSGYTILPDDEPTPSTLAVHLQELLHNYDNLQEEERELTEKSAQMDKVSSSDESGLPTEAKVSSYLQFIENHQKPAIELKDRLLLSRILLLHKSMQDLKQEINVSVNLANQQSPGDYDDVTPESMIGSSIATFNEAGSGDYCRNYDVAEGVEDFHAYQTLGAQYETLVSQFNKTNEFD